jgi:chemotaxis protein MotA
MASKQQRSAIALTTIVGLVLGIGGIIAGLVLEKGNIRDVAQYTAALIVFSGTAGAVLVSTPKRTIKRAFYELKHVFFEQVTSVENQIEELISYVAAARAKGVVSLESHAASVRDPFLRKALNMAVDGANTEVLVSTMELEIEQSESRAEEAAKVFESGGGYAPTIGILGAVLGLIQVMKNLSNIEQVGHGIAVAFVATLYGVGVANLLLLPAAAKIRQNAAIIRQNQELMLLGVVGIIEGSNPRMLREKLNAYLASRNGKGPRRLARAA